MTLLTEEDKKKRAEDRINRDFIFACERHQLDEAKILLFEEGADINWSGDGYQIAIGACAEQGDIEVARWLLEQGADLNPIQIYHTPLLTALENKEIAMAEFLIENGANINQAGLSGDTPLMWTCMANEKEAFDFLIEKGANPVIFNIETHLSALHWLCCGASFAGFNLADFSHMGDTLIRGGLNPLFQTKEKENLIDLSTQYPVDQVLLDYIQKVMAKAEAEKMQVILPSSLETEQLKSRL